MAKSLSLSRYPGRVLVLSFITTIVIGTLLLALPWARYESMSFIDLLFTATSATTVCGLMTVPIHQFTTFGHIVIFFLMQIGGLGLITMTIFFISLFMELGFNTQLMTAKLLETEHISDIKKLIGFIISFTITLELVGAFLIYWAIRPYYTTNESIWLSLFHSVSAFCNAGITLFPRGMTQFNSSPLMLTVTALLIIAGGLGFVTWYELAGYVGIIKRHKRSLNLHSKLVLTITGVLILVSMSLFWLLETNNTLVYQSVFMGILNSFFNAASVRSAGFLSVNFSELQMATVFMLMIFAFIGASPGSTGSGIKSTTFAIFLLTARAILSGRDEVEIKGRRLSKEATYRAITIIFIGLSVSTITCFCLLITEHNWNFVDILFEAVSSFSVLGVTTGLTPFLTIIGKILIMLTMFIGRLGTLTLALALINTQDKKKDYTLPEGRIIFS